MSVSFRFDPEWRTTLFVALMLPLLVSLGFWQLERADEKARIGAAFETRQALAPAPPGELLGEPAAELAYRPVTLTGHFRDEQYFLLDNRLRQGRYGNEVIGVFELEGPPGLALVNRGWLPADPARRVLPEAPGVDGRVTILGQVYVPPGEPYMLAETALAEGWPKRIQAVEVDRLAAELQVEGEMFPHLVRINVGEPGALAVDWQIINVSPAKHHGYAVQWFVMAAVLAVFYLLRSSNLKQWLGARRRPARETPDQ
jgi:cytochrome oxidase assembly protein ShyY1